MRYGRRRHDPHHGRPPLLISVALLGLLASLDPLRPAVFVMVLRTERAKLNAIGFLIGWAVALAVLFCAGLVLFEAGDSDRPSSGQKTWLSVLEMILGILLLALATRRWRRRTNASARSHTPASVLRQLEHLTPSRSGFLGALVQPRTLTLAAAVVVARDRSGPISVAAGLLVFAVLSTGALLGLFTYFVRRPDGAESWLAASADWIERASPTLFTIGCAIAGVYLLIDAIHSLVKG